MRLTVAKAAKREGTAQKVYRLRKPIPKDMKDSIGRDILLAIRKRKQATAKALRAALPKGTADATLRFYLGKFQRNKMIVARAA